jgi:hypothetical protein
MVSVDEYIGANAGVVWRALKGNGGMSVAQLTRTTGLTNAAIYASLGWLAREGKIEIRGSKPLNFKFVLRE